MNNNRNNVGEINKGKTIAVVAYLTIIGLIAALVMNKSQPTSLGRFHIRQSIGITVLAIALSTLRFVPGIGALLSKIVGAIVLIAIVVGILEALKQEERGLPVVGQFFQKWFAGI